MTIQVLPTQVTADQAREEEHWWKDPKVSDVC